VVVDKQWYTPGTLGGRGRLGSAPALAVVSDARAARVTGEALVAHHAAIVDQVAVLANESIRRVSSPPLPHHN
jgi:hypothetical protein